MRFVRDDRTATVPPGPAELALVDFEARFHRDTRSHPVTNGGDKRPGRSQAGL